MLPGRKGDPGVTAADSRLFPEAVPWRTRTGARWRDLPERFGKWNSVSRRFRRRVEGGVSGRVFQRMSGEFDLGYVRVDGKVMRAHRKAAGGKGASGQGLGRSRGGLTGRVLAMTDAPGYLVDIAIPAGQAHDLKGPGGRTFGVLVADRVSGADWPVSELERRESAVVIPSRSNRKVVREHDRVMYGWRHRIDSFLARSGEFRAVAARYDRTVAGFRATFLLVATVTAAR